MSNKSDVNFHVDKNLVVNAQIQRDGLIFRNARSAPFVISGVYYEDGMFRRLPEEVAKETSDKVHWLHANTAGGRIRFITDSTTVAISVKYAYVCRFSHFSIEGTAGFDLYIKEEGECVERYHRTMMPPVGVVDQFESREKIGDKKIREITINMPTYSNVTDVEIGLDEDSVLLAPEPYASELPIVYYGNSITQGACVSRPGNTFVTYTSRMLNSDFINLGFSGAGKAELPICNYKAGLEMRMFVCDYDHNAPNPEYLEQTHERLFKIVREKNPTLPIVLMTRTSFSVPECEIAKRREIIKRTYDNAVAAGDENVYFFDGSKVFGDLRGEATVERTHPNDLGHILIGKALTPVLSGILCK